MCSSSRADHSNRICLLDECQFPFALPTLLDGPSANAHALQRWSLRTINICAIFRPHLSQTRHASGITAVHHSRIIDFCLVCELGESTDTSSNKGDPS